MPTPLPPLFTKAKHLPMLEGALVTYRVWTHETFPQKVERCGIIVRAESEVMARDKIYQADLHVLTSSGIDKINYRENTLRFLQIEGVDELSKPLSLRSQQFVDIIHAKYLAEVGEENITDEVADWWT